MASAADLSPPTPPVAEKRSPTWFPPASVAAGDQELFGADLEEHFWVPERLKDKSAELIEVRDLPACGAAVRDAHWTHAQRYATLSSRLVSSPPATSHHPSLLCRL